jgi:phosphoglycerate dehydrogenase-like enzyme
MTKPVVGIACSKETREMYLHPDDLDRLGKVATVVIKEYNEKTVDWINTPVIPEIESDFAEFAEGLDALIVCHGGPKITRKVIEAGKRLKVVGELEGDRFNGRIDAAAAKDFGVMVVDTTHSSSWPVSEWALAMMLMGLREHARFRDIIAGKEMDYSDYRTKPPARELTGKSVGMIGFGHIAWRLREFLVPFRNEIIAYDPFAARELADALDINFAPLENVMQCDVVVCLAPDTPKTRGMIGEKEFALLKNGALFINVSRGICVDVPALIAKAEKQDAWFCLDAHDPEPLSVDTPLRGMRNVFLSPHIGGMTEEATPRFFTLMVEELERAFRGEEPRAQITERVIAGRS